MADRPPRPVTMTGAYLPGDRRVELRDLPVPVPGQGQLLLRVRASSICGSDLRSIYVEHLGTGPEAYQDVVAGHEPAGEVVSTGPGCRRFGAGDRVAVYHIAGCGSCLDCRQGYQISCTSPTRAAYGWQRDGGHATYLLVEEHTCIALPRELSFLDGALVACGFGTVYEALNRVGVDGGDAVLVTGLGPVGLAAGMVARGLGATRVLGVDTRPERLELALELGCIDEALVAGDDAVTDIRAATGGNGAEVSIDCSGSAAGRTTAVRGTRRWGRVALVGEGGRLDVDASQDLIHRQITVTGSWVTSLPHMEELVERLVRWRCTPSTTVTHRFPLDQAAQAYETAQTRSAGKVAIVTS